MTHSSEFENSSSAAAGIYRQNTFYIRMSSIFDLEPSEGEPLPAAVALHAHEYVHFLHNASTTAGQAYLLSNLTLLRAMAGGCDDQGYFRGLDEMPEQGRNFLRETVALMRAQLGTTGAKPLADCKDISLWKYSSPEVVKSDGIPSVRAVFSAKNLDGESRSQDVAIGLSFITEGVAYEVEREMRRLGGAPEVDLDTQTMIFPYLAYREVVRSWSGRDLQAEDLIAIGVAALAHSFSGYWLVQICEALKSTTQPLNSVLEKASASCRSDSEIVLAALREQRNDLSKGDVIWTAMGEYMKMAEAGVQLRQKYWAPEFSFISHPLTVEQFRRRIGAMLDCLVIQGKPNGALDMYWIGPGTVADSERSASCLGALQSALHFNQLHLTADGSAVATAALQSRPTPCPFTGGCETERNENFPSLCKSAPWMRYASAPPGELICWYAAGVKALRNSTNEAG